jgi:hypothetical protein
MLTLYEKDDINIKFKELHTLLDLNEGELLCGQLPELKPLTRTATVSSKKCLVYEAFYQDFISEFKRSFNELNNYFQGRNQFLINRAKDIKIHYYLMAKENYAQPISE